MEANIVSSMKNEEAHINLSPTEVRPQEPEGVALCCSPIIIADWMNFLGPTIIDIRPLQ
jgi:hypothetical protein